jgi:fatty acid desaturase
MAIPLPINLSDHEVEEFGNELDEIYQQTMASLGANDERYIKRLISVQRSMALISRLITFASLLFLPSWGLFSWVSWTMFLLIAGLGTTLLAIAKILENMEIAHNVLHGQWDWMRDPEINSTVWEWDHVCPADQWKNTHNVIHHTWTNVLRKDHDVGYGLLRVSDQQKWSPRYLPQAIYNVLLCIFFEWGIGIQEMNWKKLFNGTNEQRAHYRFVLKRFRHKAFRQVMKDYVLWPALAGPFFFYVMLANIVANIGRNIWTNIIIFCGHFPDDVHVFQKTDIEGETRAHWYVRQLLGSANIKGSKFFGIMSGNLNHQIEHHLFPDMPSNRYSIVAPRVQALCNRYGLPYNSGSLLRQYGTTTWKIWRLAFPGGKTTPPTL